MEETTEVCAGTIVTTKIQATYAIATSSFGTNLVTSQNNQPISLVGEHHFLLPKQGTPTVAGGPQITIGPPVRNLLLYDKNAGNQVIEVAPIELNSLQADAPLRWQEAYNIYVLNDNTNHRAREAFDKGWITFSIDPENIYECPTSDKSFVSSGTIVTYISETYVVLWKILWVHLSLC